MFLPKTIIRHAPFDGFFELGRKDNFAKGAKLGLPLGGGFNILIDCLFGTHLVSTLGQMSLFLF